MSFVNDVMAEEADRKGLILFDDYSIIKSIDLPPIHDNANVKKKYWITFLVVLIAIMGILKFVDQLPITNRSIDQNISQQSVAVQEVVLLENSIHALTEHTRQVPDENATVHNIVTPTEHVKQKSEKKSPAVVVKSRAEIKLKNTEVELEGSSLSHDSVLDLTQKKVVFEKKHVSFELINNLDSKYQTAQKLLGQGMVSEAVSELQTILKQSENLLEPRLLLASTMLENNQKQQAISVYKKGLLLHPNEARMAQPLAHLLTREGHVQQALQVLDQAAPDYRTDPEYHSLMAALYQQTGQHEYAISIYQKILSLETNNGKWWLGLGISLMAKSQNEQALAAFEWSLRDDRVTVALKQFANQRINDLKVRGRL